MKKIFLLILIFLCMCGCSNNKSTETESLATKVMGEKAKELIASGAILLDVRTQSEYDENHIEGAILLPYAKITKDTASDYLENKDSVVIVYCASGGRSAQAGKTLKSLGYTNVYDLGSIDNWEK